MLLLAVCGAVTVFTAKLLSWASRSSPPPPLPQPSRPPRPRPRPPSVANSGYDAADPQRNSHRPRPGVSLGPDSIPSVVLVERRPGGVRKANSLDAGGGAAGGGGVGMMEEDDDHPRRCRNTVQGQTLLADSEGMVCRRTELDDINHRPGCCAARPPPPLSSEEGGMRDGTGGITPVKKESYFFGRDILASDAAINIAAGESDGEPVASPPVMSAGASAGATATRQSGGGGDGGFPPEMALSTPFSCWSCDEGGEGGAGISNGNGKNNENGDGNGSSSSCCRSYEFCVACCQAPWREKEREAIRAAEALSGHPVYRELELSNNNDDKGFGWAGKELTHQLRGVDDDVRKELREGPDDVGRVRSEVRKAQEAAFAHCAFRCRTYSGSVAHENSYRSPLKYCFGRFRPPVAAAPGIMPAVRVQVGGAMLGGGLEVVESDGGEESLPSLQLDPFLAGFMDA